MTNWSVSSSTDPHGIDDIFAERIAMGVQDERLNRQEVETRLNDYDALLAVVRITQKIGTGKFVWKELTDAVAALPERLK